ncbi:DUF4181 domain-containing protein [Virgibacillus oceani]|uniref:DUF4181 domain-containing protein n=1 Tax=Virgibacillus oceani TaxID=1479511 RepID=A0A917HSK8_9BACI|nr:DUF4181 domain-containing protein [Virgibacillus oceani]GGG87996.1 hypothetical protein GCM10011398_37450 [Virgibacillus oceani]
MGIAILFIVFALNFLNIKLSKWLFKENRNKLSDTDGKKIYIFGMTILLVVSFGFMITFIDSEKAFIWTVTCILLVFSIFQSFMEWRYIKESKQFIIPVILIAVGMLCIYGVFFINEKMKYTTFQDVVSDQLNEESTVRSITIDINDFSGTLPKREASATIRDQDLINRILADFSDVELKKETGFRDYWDYTLRIITTNQVEEDHFSTESLYVHVDGDYISISEGNADVYKIVTQSNHLKTIESLVESDEVVWMQDSILSV